MSRSSSGSSVSRIAPHTGPISVPMPPTITIDRMVKDSVMKNASGTERADEGRIEASGRAADRRADAEREHLPGRRIDAERGRRNLVLADRGQRLADRRAHELIEDEIDEQREAGDQIEQRDRIAEVDDRQAGDRDRGRRRDRVDAERALRQADPVEQDLIG